MFSISFIHVSLKMLIYFCNAANNIYIFNIKCQTEFNLSHKSIKLNLTVRYTSFSVWASSVVLNYLVL